MTMRISHPLRFLGRRGICFVGVVILTPSGEGSSIPVGRPGIGRLSLPRSIVPPALRTAKPGLRVYAAWLNAEAADLHGIWVTIRRQRTARLSVLQGRPGNVPGSGLVSE